MGYIANYLTDKLQAKIAEKLVDDTTFRRKQRSGLLQEFMPFTTYTSEDFLAFVTEKVAPIASIVAKDGQVPTTGFGSFGKITGELARIALARQYDGETQDRMRKVMEEAMYKQAPIMTYTDPNTGMVKQGVNDALVKYLYGSIESLIEGFMDRALSMAWEAVSTGELNITDPRTKINFTLNYREQGEAYDALHFPAALTDTGNTSDRTLNRWTDYSNADGIGMMEKMVLDYIDTNGFPPDRICMSYRALRHLQQQETTIQRARQAVGLAQVGSVSRPMIKEIMMANSLPEIVTFDELYDTELTNPGVTNTKQAHIQKVRFLNENRIVFMKAGGMGEIALGQTIEQKNIKTEDGLLSSPMSSIMVRVYERSKIPMLDEMMVYGCAMPVIYQARYLGARTVF